MRSDDYYFNVKSKFLKCQLITLNKLLDDATDFACIRDDLRDLTVINKHFDSLEVCSFMNNDAIKSVLSWKQFNLLKVKKELLFLFLNKIEKAIKQTEIDIKDCSRLKIEGV